MYLCDCALPISPESSPREMTTDLFHNLTENLFVPDDSSLPYESHPVPLPLLLLVLRNQAFQSRDSCTRCDLTFLSLFVVAERRGDCNSKRIVV